MTTARDPDEILAGWLEEGPSRLPEPTRRAIVVQTRTIRQSRRPMWVPGRTPPMNPFARVALGGVAVVAMLLGALYIVNPAGSGIGGVPAATPSPTPTPSPSPSPSHGPVALGESDTVLEPGTYVTADPFPLRIRLTVPEGWRGRIGGPYLAYVERTSGSGLIAFSIFDKVFADPCHSADGYLDRTTGSVDTLATALAGLPSVDVTTPVDAMIGGLSGKQLTITAPTVTTGCTLASGGVFPVWELPLGSTNGLQPGQVDRVWIIDVDGTRLVVDATHSFGTDAPLDAEIQTILDSILIETTGG